MTKISRSIVNLTVLFKANNGLVIMTWRYRFYMTDYDFIVRFHASLYPCPDTAQERRQVALGVMTRIEDLQIVKH